MIRMPQILFDPPSEDGLPQLGGTLEGEKRAEYVELCKQMTSRNPDLDYRGIRDRILQILEEDVRRYIDTLPPEDKVELLKDFNEILSTIPKAEHDPDPLSTINVLSLQISILFTEYELKKNNSNDPFGAENWKDHAALKNELRTFTTDDTMKLYYLLNPLIRLLHFKENPPIFMVFLGFLKIDEIVESYFKNVFFLGLSYKTDYVDGALLNPMQYLYHDILHFQGYEDECMDTIFIPILKDFYEYVKGYDKSIRYSINFALFVYLHEAAKCIKRKDFFTSQHLIEAINKSLERRISQFCNLEILGKAIPSTYRTLVEGSTIMLKEEKVIEYINLVLERFVTVWNEFMVSVNHGIKGGRRKARRTKKNRQKKKLTRKRMGHK